MCLSSRVKKIVNIIENFKILPLVGYGVSLLTLSFYVVLSVQFYKLGNYKFSVLSSLLTIVPYLITLILIFTKKSKFYGAHVARIFGAFVYFASARVMYALLPKGESKWYGDCLMTNNGNFEIQSFFSFIFAFLSYYLVKYLINKFILNKNEIVKIFNLNANLNTKENLFSRIFNFVNNLKLPHKFGMQLFIICLLGHVFFGFTNAHLYNASLEYGNGSFSKDIYSWHIMDVLLLFASILVALFTFKVKYEGAMFCRFCTFLVFSILNLSLGYVCSLNAFKILMLLGAVLSFYLVFRFFVLRFLIKNNGNYGV